MKKQLIIIKYLLLSCLFIGQVIFASVPKDLSYPSGNIDAQSLVEQVYFVNHFYSFKNYGIGKKDNIITTLILRAKGSEPLTNALERYLNNDYSDGNINSRDFAVFRSGKFKGTAMLVTDFVNPKKYQSYEVFIPHIRKVRRLARPAKNDAWVVQTLPLVM